LIAEFARRGQPARIRRRCWRSTAAADRRRDQAERIALGVGWGTLVAAELIAATRGIGYPITSASQFLATDVVFVGIGVIAACAFAFSFAMRTLERWPIPWKGQG